MDKNRFDGFTRQLAKKENRRQAIKTLFAGGVGAAAVVVAGGETSAAKPDCCPADHPTLCGLTCTDTISSAETCGGCDITCNAEEERCYKGVCESTSVVHCTAVSDCPPSDSECATPTCKKGICGTSYTPSGRKTTAQTAGDCQKNICDGAGHITSIADNTDKPAAQGECWTGICVNGVPQQNALPSGRKCSTGKCNGAGVCSGGTGGCTSPGTCPGTDDECQTRTCTNGVCGMSFQPVDTLTSNQTTGDCKKNVCDGSGNVISVNDDTDVIPPNSGNDCVDSICTAGTPSQPPKAAGALCSGGVCDGSGACAECLTPLHCIGGVANAITTCNGGHCGYTCISGYTDCPNGAGCLNISIDPANCGACGHACVIPNGHAFCANGACALAGCDAGFENCDGNPVTGCEVNTSLDDNNCGACNNKCVSGTHCAASVCQ